MIPPRRVLVVVTRRIGDVLLATPLIRALQRAWPQTHIDALVFAGTEGVLAANPDVRRVITIAERPGPWQHLALLASIARRYDIALSLVPSDRPTLYAAIAGRWRAGLVVDTPKHRWKKWLLNRWAAFDNLNVHTVLMHLKLAALLDIPPCHEVVAPWHAADESHVSALLQALGSNRPFAVLHLYPNFNYKMWRDEAWLDCARALAARGLALALTGSTDALECAYVGRLAAAMPGAINLAGQLTLAQAACLIARAQLYVGPDTALTHMAAARGVPTIAIYGPTDPVKWGPWPRQYTGPENPWRRVGSQARGNVRLIQGVQACTPCLKEGCDRHVASFSDCLLELPASRVIAAAESLLGGIDDRKKRLTLMDNRIGERPTLTPTLSRPGGRGGIPSPRLIEHCPAGCNAQLVTSAIVLPEGPLLRCAACGQLVSQITADAYRRSMAAFDSPGFNRPSGSESARRVALARRRLARAGRLLGKTPDEIRLIDVGCSRGDFVAAAAQLGFHAEGVEPAPHIAAEARASGLTVHPGSLEEQRFPAASFDVVTLFEVIEHLPAPMTLLHECHRILRPKGILIASTGNTASWTVAAMQARWDYFHIAQDAGHVSFFNPRSIALLAARTGFGVEHIGTTRVRFVEESSAPRWLYRLTKLTAEIANLPARLLGTGHDMLVFLRRV